MPEATADLAIVTKEVKAARAVERSRRPIPVEATITPKGKLIGKSGYAEVYLDRKEGVVFRVLKRDELKRIREQTGDELFVDYAKRDFQHKVEVGKADSTDLTPKVYEYDPENGIIKMEYIEGIPLDKFSGRLPESAIQAFLSKLGEFHKLGLYHGDLFTLAHYILTSDGQIRLIDPSYMYSIPDKGIEYFQEIDKALAEKRLRELQRDLFVIREQREGEFITEAIAELNEAIENDQVTSVYQKGIGFVDGNDPETRFLETSGFAGEHPFFGSCVLVIAWGPESKIGGILHADTLTDVSKAMWLLDKRFQVDESVELSVVGGQTDTSESILREVNKMLGPLANKRGWVLKRIDILGPKNVKTRQVILDAQRGDVFNFQGEAKRRVLPWIEMSEEIKKRQQKAAMTTREIIIDSDLENAPE